VAGTKGTHVIENAVDPDDNMELLWTDLARVVAQAGDRLTRVKQDTIR
jgi:hypothetical protein